MPSAVTLKGLLCLAALGLCATPSGAHAQSWWQRPDLPDSLSSSYPARPITVVVPFPAGGPSDVVARIVTEQMGKIFGQNLVIENVGGAGGTLGSGRVAATPPDGYTLLAGSMGSHVSAPVLTPDIKYDFERDFVPVGITAHAPAVIVARKDFPAKDLREFVAYLRNNGDQVKQAHGGVGASSHMACLCSTSRPAPNRLWSLSRHRPGDERPHRRPCRLLLRAGGERRSADFRRREQGLRDVRLRTAGGLARYADCTGSGGQLPDEHLGRHLRTEGHVKGDHRQARHRA